MLSGEFCFFFRSCHKNLHSSDTVYHGATIFNGSRTHKRLSFYEGMGSVIPIKLPVRENEKTQFLSFEGLWAKLALTIVEEKSPYCSAVLSELWLPISRKIGSTAEWRRNGKMERRRKTKCILPEGQKKCEKSFSAALQTPLLRWVG